MGKAAKKVWTADELALSSILPAVSGDETRAHLCKPFGQEMHGRGFVIGTDGHRLHAAACDGWAAHCREAAPPAAQVIPWDAPWIGEFNAAALDDARVFPAKWDVALETHAGGAQRLHTSVRTGKKGKLYPFGRDGVAVSYFKLEQLTFSFAVQLHYLLDAVDCLGVYGSIHVWSVCDKKHPGLDPIAFTRTSKPLREQERIAVVMPRRI